VERIGREYAVEGSIHPLISGDSNMTDRNESAFHKKLQFQPAPPMLVAAASMLSMTAHAQNSAAPQTEGLGRLEEVTVTATRQTEALSRVPISVTAFTQEQMDSQGLKEVDDLVRYTPGLNLNRAANGGNDISIRGISSSAGAATTGVYVDDTPIQVRNLGYNAGTAFPALFDLERVEVLRGPQGTLFGAGSEGGTVRFIQTTPSLTEYSGYGRGEFSEVRGGSTTYEAGVALGGPIAHDRLGFRASAFHRREGGYIDGVSGSMTANDPSGARYGDSITYTPTGTTRPNMNWSEVTGFRGALKLALGDSLSIMPSVSYQKQHFNDGFDVFWLASSDPESAKFTRPVFDAGNPATNPRLTGLNSPNRDEGDDEFYMPALLVNWQLGSLEFVSNTSYFDRETHQYFDFTGFYNFLYMLAPQPRSGDKASSLYENSQRNFTQEVRLQSSDPDARLRWVAGLFYSKNDQEAGQAISNNFIANEPRVGVLGDPLSGVRDGSPFGPGSSALINYFGVPLGAGSILWSADFGTVDKQVAAFVQADFKITPQWKLTAGLRVSSNRLDLDASYGSPVNNLTYPTYVFAANPATCPGGACTPGAGAFTPVFPASTESTKETSTTPKVGISYQLNDENLFYATAAKGFRPAGASLLVPLAQCGRDLQNIGYLDSNGNSTQPVIYDSDSVWSYELGSKNHLFGGRVLLDSSIYQIRWSNIQTAINLPICAYNFVDNVGHATSEGFDLSVRSQVIDSLTLGATFGYNKTTFDEDVATPNGKVLYGEGSGVPGVGAPMTLSVSGQYDFNLFGDREFYFRSDFSRSSTHRAAGATSPDSSTYRPLFRRQEAYSVLNLRLGTQVLEGGDLSVFVNNATNSHPYFGLGNGGPLGGYPAVWSASTLRPRTYGMTLLYRY
jgi:outer membrane receptor protein involved in Fe transport